MASTTPTAHVLCVGPLLLDRLTFLSDDLERIHPAGNALIFSAVAARMGLKVAVAGQTGADDNGDIIARFLEIHGVGSSHVRRLVGRVTKVTKVIIDLDGEWRRESANIDVFPYIDAEYVQTICGLEAYTNLHFAGLNALVRVAPDATARLLKSYRECGVRISFGLTVSRCDLKFLEGLIESPDILFCTESEYWSLQQAVKGPSDLFDSVRRSRFENCVITRGKHGAIAKWRGSEFYRIRAIETTQRNTLGAGDTFSSVTLAALLSGHPIEAALSIASVAASKSIANLTWSEWIESNEGLRELAATLSDKNPMPNIVRRIEPTEGDHDD